MTISKLFPSGIAPGVLVTALLSSFVICPRAHAFGGLWSSQSGPIKQVSEQIIFVDNPDATVTAIIRFNYEGPAQKFAWVIPVPGKPSVGVSSNIVFERLDAATAPQYWVEQTVEGACMEHDVRDASLDAGEDPADAPSALDPTPAPMLVLDRGAVGPYEYVTAAVDPSASDAAKAATDWLSANGYDLTDLDGEVLGPYLEAGFNLLAFKLGSDSDLGAIRPVTLTLESELPALPIRPAAVAARADMGIQLWVIGPSQAVSDNYESLVLNDARIDWLSGRTYPMGTLPSGGVGPFDAYGGKPSNYDAVVTAAANEAGGQGFVTELGGPASQYRDKVWSALDDQTFTSLSNQTYTDGIDAILSASSRYGGWDGWKDAIDGATSLPADVTIDAFALDPEQYRAVASVDTGKFFELLEQDVIKPVADTAALLYQAPYLTRLYSTMSASEMTLDPAFDYNPDLAQVDNIHIAKQLIQCSSELDRDEAPWRMELPQGGVVIGAGSRDWPVDEDALPANLKVVMLGASGSGTVVADNSEEIGTKLFKAAGSSGSATALLRPPQNGVLIGGNQTVTQPSPPASMPRSSTLSLTDDCSVSRAGSRPRSTLALWLALAGIVLALCRRRSSMMKRYAAYAWVCLLLAGCSSDDGEPAQADAGAAVSARALTREELLDPNTCKGCHPIHFREWSSSMHAYSAKDPVFVAMNKRGQRETHGELGDFCIQCHAPMAVVDKLTPDGLDLDQLPDKERGVSCYFCHNVASIEGDHNAMLRLANDTTMRGPIRDPLQPGVHGAEYSELLEDTSPSGSAMCGSCHDIVTPSGVHLERTFQEYRSGIFSKSATGEPPAFDSCMGCHMRPQTALAAIAPKGVMPRTVHEHLWPGIDVPLTDFPHREALRSAVEDCQLGAASVSFFTLEVTPPDLFTFQLETSAGHNQPSGSAQDRRMWLELMAYDENGKLLEQVSSGNIGDHEIEDRPEDDPKRDPHLLLFRDRIYDGKGKPVHMFWQAAKSAAHPDGYESNVLPAASTTYVEGKHAVLQQYRAAGPDGLPARVTARLRMRPIGLDVLQDLVDSGDLDPAIAAQMPTFTFGAQVDWTPESGLMQTVRADPGAADCSTYRCLLDPGSPACH